MRTGFGALAALGLMFVMGVGPAVANEAARGASSAQQITTQFETGYVTTQGRGRGGFRGNRGGGGFARGGRGRNFNRNVGIGVGALVLGGIIASQSSRASGYGGGGNSCRRWAYQCDQGAGWACRNFNRNC